MLLCWVYHHSASRPHGGAHQLWYTAVRLVARTVMVLPGFGCLSYGNEAIHCFSSGNEALHCGPLKHHGGRGKSRPPPFGGPCQRIINLVL